MPLQTISPPLQISSSRDPRIWILLEGRVSELKMSYGLSTTQPLVSSKVCEQTIPHRGNPWETWTPRATLSIQSWLWWTCTYPISCRSKSWQRKLWYQIQRVSCVHLQAFSQMILDCFSSFREKLCALSDSSLDPHWRNRNVRLSVLPWSSQIVDGSANLNIVVNGILKAK